MQTAKKMLAMTALCLLTACGSSTPLLSKPPANLTIACAPISPLAENADMGELIDYTLSLIGLYKECAKRHEALAKTT